MMTDRPDPVLLQATDAWLEGYHGPVLECRRPMVLLGRDPDDARPRWVVAAPPVGTGTRGSMPACVLDVELLHPAARDHTLRKLAARLGLSTVSCPLLEVEVLSGEVFSLRLATPEEEECWWFCSRAHLSKGAGNPRHLPALDDLDGTLPPEVLQAHATRLLWQEVCGG